MIVKSIFSYSSRIELLIAAISVLLLDVLLVITASIRSVILYFYRI